MQRNNLKPRPGPPALLIITTSWCNPKKTKQNKTQKQNPFREFFEITDVIGLHLLRGIKSPVTCAAKFAGSTLTFSFVGMASACCLVFWTLRPWKETLLFPRLITIRTKWAGREGLCAHTEENYLWFKRHHLSGNERLPCLFYRAVSVAIACMRQWMLNVFEPDQLAQIFKTTRGEKHGI